MRWRLPRLVPVVAAEDVEVVMVRNPTPAPLTAEREAAIRARLADLPHLTGNTWCDCCEDLPDVLAARDALAREVETLRRERDARADHDRDVLAFIEWAQGWLDAGRWAGHSVFDAVKTEALERTARAEAAEARLQEAADTCPVCASVRDHRVDCGCDRCDRKVLVEERRALVAALREAERERDEAQAPAGQTPPPAPAACPERDECLRLRGQPIGMYHCTHCGTMVLAGVDPTPLCPRVSGGGTEAHETPTPPALTAEDRAALRQKAERRRDLGTRSVD